MGTDLTGSGKTTKWSKGLGPGSMEINMKDSFTTVNSVGKECLHQWSEINTVEIGSIIKNMERES